ncbi:MAG: tetratricopeptide repeat protein [Lachnospiraceae bacterium]|nr:tetratricopeptide repeat protein [Lachnospiraceae bacterium]
MEIAEAFKILQMEKTDDEAAIKKQYRSLLPLHNPEDDPEGFKALREAYELALHPPKDEEEKEPEDEIGRWLKKVEAVYLDMKRRRDTAEWEELLRDPLCEGLDTAFETRERLLVFIMDHQYLPRQVWVRLNETFRFVEEQEDLLEKFPPNFIEYVNYQCENETFGNYDLFEYEGDGQPDYDGWITAFYALNRRVSGLENSVEQQRLEGGDQEQRSGPIHFFSGAEILRDHEDLKKELDEAVKDADKLEAMGIKHPYLDTERLRLSMIPEDGEALCGAESISEISHRLLNTYGKDHYVGRIAGEGLALAGEWEEALPVWQRIQEEAPERSSVYFDIAGYHFHKGDFETAENIIREHISGLNGSLKVKNFFLRVQKMRDEAYLKRLEEDPDDLGAWIEMCWSRFHSDRIKETYDLLEQKSYVPGTSEYYDYVDMKGRCLLEMEQYEEALVWLKKWEKALEELPDDGTDKYAKRKKTLGYQRFVIAECYGHLALERPDKSLYETALEYVSGAIETEDDESMILPYRDLKHRIMLRAGKYREVVDECDQRIKDDRNDLPAYLRRQEAYYRLRNGQGVVDDYHSIMAIYRDYYRPYLLALRVFLAFHQEDDAIAVLKTAKENSIDHPTLHMEELRLLRRLQEKEGGVDTFLKKAGSLLKDLEENPPEEDPAQDPEDVVTPDHVYFEMAGAAVERDDMDGGLKLCEERIEAGTKLRGFYMLRANILRLKEQYDRALQAYREILEKDSDNVMAWYYMGLSFRGKGGLYGEEIRCFKKAQELDPEEDRAVYELARTYQNRYLRYQALVDYENAKKQFDRLVELNPSPFVYSARADLLRYSGDLDGAIADLKTALEKSEGDESDDSFRLYRIGDLEFLQRHTDKAEAIFREGLEKYGDMQTAPIYQLADTLGSRGKWDEAIKVLERYAESYKENGNYLNKMAEIRICCGQPEETLKLYKKLFEIGWLKEWQYYDAQLEVVLQTDPGAFEERFRELDPQFRKLMGVGFADLHMDYALYSIWNKKRDKGKLENIYRYFLVVGRKLLYARMLQRALSYLRRAMDLNNYLGKKDGARILEDLALCYRFMSLKNRLASDKKQWAVNFSKWGIKALMRKDTPKDLLEEQGEDMSTEEYYLKCMPCDNAIRYSKLARLYLIAGDMEKYEQYISAIDKCTYCLSCRYQECYDALIVKAYAAEFEGDHAKAKELFSRAKAIAPTDIENATGVYANG